MAELAAEGLKYDKVVGQFADIFTLQVRDIGSFYEENFRLLESLVATKYGRSLPAFRIPSAWKGGVGGFRRRDGFYDDIFGSNDDRRLRSLSKSETKSKLKLNSLSVLSAEDLSPLPLPISEDVGFSSFTSKLRYSQETCQSQGFPIELNGMTESAVHRDLLDNHLSFILKQQPSLLSNFLIGQLLLNSEEKELELSYSSPPILVVVVQRGTTILVRAMSSLPSATFGMSKLRSDPGKQTVIAVENKHAVPGDWNPLRSAEQDNRQKMLGKAAGLKSEADL
ncbi:hypothetical protein NE237_019008 [Protea cynaroides]|uniref:Uncharacterized protein n=1 Tax=Protea cynaroides TaxID=273540 RepID=A0A9Q0KB26_9MAGN|nr:hypothetical protein NE237_019008 [Protea cynaroides]